MYWILTALDNSGKPIIKKNNQIINLSKSKNRLELDIKANMNNKQGLFCNKCAVICSKDIEINEKESTLKM